MTRLKHAIFHARVCGALALLSGESTWLQWAPEMESDAEVTQRVLLRETLGKQRPRHNSYMDSLLNSRRERGAIYTARDELLLPYEITMQT